MLKSDEMKSVAHSKNLFEEIQELITRTKKIFADAASVDSFFIFLIALENTNHNKTTAMPPTTDIGTETHNINPT